MNYFILLLIGATTLFACTENTKEGEVFIIQGQGVYSQDTSEPPEGVTVIKSTSDFSRHLEDNPMKSKKCHLPVKIFSAR